MRTNRYGRSVLTSAVLLLSGFQIPGCTAPPDDASATQAEVGLDVAGLESHQPMAAGAPAPSATPQETEQAVFGVELAGDAEDTRADVAQLNLVSGSDSQCANSRSKCKTDDYQDSYGVRAPQGGYYLCGCTPTRKRGPQGTDNWFVVGTNRQVYQNFQQLDRSWRGWFSLGGTAQSRVTVDYLTQYGAGISVDGTYNGRWCKDWGIGEGWNGWWDC